MIRFFLAILVSSPPRGTVIELDLLSYLFRFFDGIVLIQLATLLFYALLIPYDGVLCK